MEAAVGSLDPCGTSQPNLCSFTPMSNFQVLSDRKSLRPTGGRGSRTAGELVERRCWVTVCSPSPYRTTQGTTYSPTVYTIVCPPSTLSTPCTNCCTTSELAGLKRATDGFSLSSPLRLSPSSLLQQFLQDGRHQHPPHQEEDKALQVRRESDLCCGAGGDYDPTAEPLTLPSLHATPLRTAQIAMKPFLRLDHLP